MRSGVFAYVSRCLVIAVIVARVHAADEEGDTKKESYYKSLDEVQTTWAPGNRIICRMPKAPKPFRFHHYMLVADGENIIHTVKREGKYYIVEESYKTYSDKPIAKYCHNKGNGKLEDAVQRAREWESEKPIFYSHASCNSRHYVNAWTKGFETMHCPSYAYVPKKKSKDENAEGNA